MSNAVFGKEMENVCKDTETKFVTTIEKKNQLVSEACPWNVFCKYVSNRNGQK